MVSRLTFFNQKTGHKYLEKNVFIGASNPLLEWWRNLSTAWLLGVHRAFTGCWAKPDPLAQKPIAAMERGCNKDEP